MIWQDIVEARSNPDKNPRAHMLVELAKYAGQKDVFVSFTSDFSTHTKQTPGPKYGMAKPLKNARGQSKIGIYPKSNFETPLGIYTYPIDYVLAFSTKAGDVDAPFTGNSPWRNLYVLRLTTPRYLNDESDIGPTFSKLHDLAVDTLGEDDGNKLVGEAITTALLRDDPRSKMWNLSRLLAERSTGVANGMTDTGATKFGVFGKTASVAWNVIMRRVGVDAYIDDKGRGIIHSNEPTQAVFFTTQAFRVIDVLERFDVKTQAKYKSETQIMKGIKTRSIDLNTVNPVFLRKLLASTTTTNDDLRWVASKLGPIQRRIINETLTRWPHGLAFDTDTLDALRLFGPIPSEVIISMGTAVHDGELTDWPKWFARLPTMDEWREIFSAYKVEGDDPNVKLIKAKAPWINEEFLLNAFKARLNNFPHVGVIQHVAKENDVPMTDVLLEECFVRYPNKTLEAFPDHKWSFKDWYRAARTINHMSEGLGGIIPLEVAMPILMRDDRKTFMNQELLERLIKEKPEFVALWFPLHGEQMWNKSFPALDDFVAEYLPTMAARNPEMLRFIKATPWTRSDHIVKALWRYVGLNGRFASRSLEWALTRGWISQDDFAKHLRPSIAGLVNDWERFGWGHIDDDLWVRAMVMLDQIDAISVDQVPALMRTAPQMLRKWHGKMTPTDARSLFDEYPEARTNASVLLQLDTKSIYELFENGTLDFEKSPDTIKFKIITASCEHDPHTVFKMQTEHSRMADYPRDYLEWRSYMKPDTLIKGGIEGCKVNDTFAWIMVQAYNTEVEDLQMEVSERVMHLTMEWNINAFVCKHLFGNQPSPALRTKAQFDFMHKNLDNWQNRNLPFTKMAEIVKMLFSKMLMPQPEVISNYAQWLNDATPEGAYLAAEHDAKSAIGKLPASIGRMANDFILDIASGDMKKINAAVTQIGQITGGPLGTVKDELLTLARAKVEALKSSK